MARLESQMEDIMGYPTGGDPSIIDPTTGKPYDDSSRMRQQAEITRQADAMEAFQNDENKVKLPKLLEEKITPLFNKPEIKFSAQDLEKQYKDYNPEFGKANELDDYGMKRYVADRSSFLTEPKLNTYNTSLIDTIIDAGFLLRNETQGVTNEKSLLSNFDKIKDRPAVIGFLKEALGPGPYGEGFDINKASWCAAFVNHILGIAGFDQLKYGENKSEESYNKIRANAYLKYGTPVDSLEDAKEGDIIIWDLKPNNSDDGTHVTFYAGDRYGKQGVGDSVDIVGGNHGARQSVSLKGSGSEDVYVKKNIRGIVRVTKNNITQDFVNELADIDPIFKPFTELNKKGNPVPLVSLRPQLRPKKFNEGGSVTSPYKRSHPSAMPADDYYDMQARQDEDKQTKEAFVEPTVPFFERPMDSDESDRIVGQDDAGNLVRQTALGNTYTVSPNPDQRTTRTKVTDAADAFLENPRLPTKDEVVGAGKAALEGAVDVVSTPKRLLTGEQSPTETQMGDVFDVSVGTGIIGATQKLPENALGMFMGRYAKNLPEGDIKEAFIADLTGMDTGTLNELGELVPTDFGGPEDYTVHSIIRQISRGADLPKAKQAVLDAGWSEGKDGKYRWELSDKDAKVDESKFTVLSAADIDSAINAPLANVNYSELGDVLDHPNLYKNYPDLKTMPVFVDTDLTGTTTAGYFNTQEGYLAIAQDQLNNPKELKRTLLHEVMHRIQQKEGFDSGTNKLSDEVRKIYDSRANAPEAKAAWAKYDQDIANYDFNHIPKSLDLFRNIIKFSEDNNLNYGNTPFIEDAKSKFVDSIRAAKMARDARRDLGPNSSEYKKLLQFAIDTSASNTLKVMRRFSRLMEAAERGAMGPRSYRITQDYRDLFKDLPIMKDGSLMFNAENLGTQLLGLEQPLLPDYINPNATPTQISADKRLIYRSKSGEVEATNVEYRMDFDDAQRSENSPKETEFGATGFERDEQFTTEQARALPNTYAQGGLTSMNNQTQRAFALGGQAETVDPVSGNDVPPGSLPEEVRDDIDAKLSEGEYVVPADVVRFFGVKYFEDLRTEAKMGLQQMDADGRIGGEPVPAQEQPQGQDDSMDVAKLKAALSSSGMYAGGLTDGNSLDNFIDDASRSPMVNGRMRAGGATVKMAVGGLVPTGTYGDVTKVDGIIKQLMTAANNDPVLMEKLSSKGIMINKTGADKKSAEMQQANKPQEPLKAAKGTLVSPDPFNLEDYDNLGSSIFDAAGIEDPLKAIEATFLDSNGVIEQIVLIAPDGMEIPVAWNSAMPIPPGFTKKATNEDVGTKPVASAAPVNNSLVRRKAGDGKTGDDSDTGGGGGEPTTTSTPFDYRGVSIEDLKSRLDKTKKYSKIGSIIGVFAGPVGTVIGLAAKANYGIVKRRIEIELDTRIKEGTITAKDLGSEKNPNELRVLIADVSTKRKLSAAEKIVADENAKLKNLDPEAFIEKQRRSIFNVAPDQKGVLDKFLDAAAQNAADKIAEEVLNNQVDGTPTTSGRSSTKPKLKGLEKVTALKAAQDFATTKRLEKERKDEEARKAAQAAANAQAARARQAAREAENERERGDDGPNFSSSDEGGGGSSNFGVFTGRTVTKSDGTKGKGRSDYKEGGLVSMPAAKKKKQTTQRRKGLGTRP